MTDNKYFIGCHNKPQFSPIGDSHLFIQLSVITFIDYK